MIPRSVSFSRGLSMTKFPILKILIPNVRKKNPIRKRKKKISVNQRKSSLFWGDRQKWPKNYTINYSHCNPSKSTHFHRYDSTMLAWDFLFFFDWFPLFPCQNCVRFPFFFSQFISFISLSKCLYYRIQMINLKRVVFVTDFLKPTRHYATFRAAATVGGNQSDV